jgi:phenylacetate-CoA ligase
MEKVTGRSDDMIILRGVNLFPSQIEEIVLGIPGLTAHYQCVLTKPDRMDALEIRVEARAGFAADHERAEMARQVAKRIKDVIGVRCAVDVVRPNEIERSASGKARRLVDNRPK